MVPAIFEGENMTNVGNPLANPLGWRARLGLIIPQLDLLSEPLFPQVLPEGVAVHTARMRRRGEVNANSLVRMNAAIDDAIELLPTPYIDAVIYHCTMGSLLYSPTKLADDITGKTGLPTISTTASVVNALNALGSKKICLVSPYPEELNIAEVEFFERAGFSVPIVGGDNIPDAIEMARVAGEEINAWVRRAWRPECDAVFITCTGLRSQEYICQLEAQVGVPVITSTSAVLWEVFRFLKAPMSDLAIGRLANCA